MASSSSSSSAPAPVASSSTVASTTVKRRNAPCGRVVQAYPLTITNLVSKMRMGIYTHDDGTGLSIEDVADVFHGRVATDLFPAAMVSSRIPTCTAVIFKNGKVQIVGTANHSDTVLALHWLRHRMMLHMCVFPRMHHLAVCNVVAALSLGHNIDLRAIHDDFRGLVTYNPNVFEGLHYIISDGGNRGRKKNRRMIATIFYSGRIIVTGARSLVEHVRHQRTFIPMVRQYRVTQQELQALFQKEAEARDKSRKHSEHIQERTRVWLAPPLVQEAGFYRASRGVGGCLHEAGWKRLPAGAVVCVTCNRHATPFVFCKNRDDCLHENSWTNDSQLTFPVCDSCGLTDNSEDSVLFNKWQRLHNMRKKRERARTANKRVKEQTNNKLSDELRKILFTLTEEERQAEAKFSARKMPEVKTSVDEAESTIMNLLEDGDEGGGDDDDDDDDDEDEEEDGSSVLVKRKRSEPSLLRGWKRIEAPTGASGASTAAAIATAANETVILSTDELQRMRQESDMTPASRRKRFRPTLAMKPGALVAMRSLRDDAEQRLRERTELDLRMEQGQVTENELAQAMNDRRERNLLNMDHEAQ